MMWWACDMRRRVCRVVRWCLAVIGTAFVAMFVVMFTASRWFFYDQGD